MTRRAVRSGLIDQRDRATQRRRSRSESPRAAVSEPFDAWLETWSTGIPDIRRIDLERFLAASSHFDLDAAERLVQLAIHLELAATSLPGLSGWESLRRVYELARELSPADAMLPVSMSYSARWLGEGAPDEKRLLDISENYAREAVRMAPDDGRGHYALGRALYDQGRVESALEAFVRTHELEPDPAMSAWTHLYKGHCLHDLERWNDALSSYDAVDRSQLTGSSAWRSDVLAEQRAYCLFKVGQKDDAVALLQRILDRYEAEPHLGYWAMSASFWQLIQSAAPEHLDRAEGIDEHARRVAIG